MTREGQQPNVRVEEDRLVVKSFSTTDRSVVAHFSQIAPGDIERELDRSLALGVRVSELAGPVLGVELVRRTFEETARKHSDLIDESRAALRNELCEVLEPLFGKGGSVPEILRQTREAMERELSRHFDEDSAKSIGHQLSERFDEAIRASERRIQERLGDALDPADDSKGIGRVYKAIRTDSAALNAQLADLLSKISALVARKEERGQSSRKGYEYEEGVFLEVSRLARLFGDSAERTANSSGLSHRRRGDITVTLDSNLTSGVEVRFVLEVMDRANGSQRAIVQELDEAKINRAAPVGIAVLSSKDAPAAGGQVLHILPRNRLLCVLDVDEWNTLPLELAYLWARTEVLKTAGSASLPGIDLTSLSNALDEAVRHLGDIDKLRTKLSVSRTGLTDAEALISEIEANLTRCLAKASAILRASEDDSQL